MHQIDENTRSGVWTYYPLHGKVDQQKQSNGRKNNLLKRAVFNDLMSGMGKISADARKRLISQFVGDSCRLFKYTHYSEHEDTNISYFEAQSHGFSICCLRFTSRVTSAPCKTRFRSLVKLYRVGVQPTGFQREVSIISYQFPPLLGLSCRDGMYDLTIPSGVRRRGPSIQRVRQCNISPSATLFDTPSLA